MDLPRKVGIGIVMIVPTFVFAALFFSWFHSYVMVFFVMIAMAVLYGFILTGKLFGKPREEADH
ncbi:MAG: hypothetical protein JRF65_09780 [Deltaproteobacteria bacterium]|nr:hypothetical protein [Deltaproteobacteria bacterium]